MIGLVVAGIVFAAFAAVFADRLPRRESRIERRLRVYVSPCPDVAELDRIAARQDGPA